MVKNQKFREGSQNVFFDQFDRVIKLDQHRFYRYVSGRGFKGVDFLVLNPEIGIVLIELKNYINGHHPIEKEIASTFYQKCEDTLHLIEIVYKYYQKKWWIKILVNTFRFTFLLSKEDKFWIDAYQEYQVGRVLLLGNIDVEHSNPIN